MPIEPLDYPIIKPETALGRALVDFFEVLEPIYASGEKGVFQAIVFGGCAVHVHTLARGSADVDAEVASHGHADRSEIIALLGSDAYIFADEGGVSQMLELDSSFNTTLGPLHEDYEDRVVRLVTNSCIPNVEVYIAGAMDLAISKLGRFGERDQEDTGCSLGGLPSEHQRFVMLATISHKQLHRVGCNTLENAVEDIKNLAEAIWYQGDIPTWDELVGLRMEMTKEAFQRLLCVIELLSQYPVCERETARQLQQMTQRLHQELLGGGDQPVRGRYSPSKRWGLADTTAPLRKALLPLQTRHYADSTGYRHGLR